MSKPIADSGSLITLRQRAQQHLATGTAPATRGWGLGPETLALLHNLANTPASAADALKLLHELQVHQVELDLQQAQIEANEHEAAEELARFRSLYELSPVAHFVLDAGGLIAHCNRAAAELLGTGASDPSGRRFDELLSPDSRPTLAALLRDVRGGAMRPRCTVRMERGSADPQHWRLTASAVPASDAIQLVVTDGAGTPVG